MVCLIKKKSSERRGVFALVLLCTVLALLLIKLFNVQIFSADVKKEAAVTTVEVSVPPVRGEIYDRNGKLLVTNKQINTVIIDYLTFPEGADFQGRNEVLDTLIKFFDKHKIEWIDNLPLKVTGGVVSFDEDKPAEIQYLKSEAYLDLNYYATAQNCFDALVERYKLDGYSLKDARKIASVYYSMRKKGFSASVPYVFAEDVSNDFIAVIKENSNMFRGVDVSVESERQYLQGNIAPHIVGVVGPLNDTEYEANKDNGYALNDVIGKTGLELTFEKELRGTAGKKLVSVDANGVRTEKIIEEPVNGAAIILTIDADLQKVAQDALKKLVLEQQLTRDVTCGSVVVMDTRSNGVLACASYPTFNLETYYDDYEALSADKSKPFWNRALRSTYTPGSTIKPCVAMAGLEEGVINAQTVVSCHGKYTYYEDYQPGCTGRHGGQNVVNALYHSCNIFFYETSRLLGIDKLDKYFTMFGLGEKTGIELSESSGIVDTPDFRRSIGDMWTPGLTIQAGIGHGDNNFTPIQLCSYVSTIANRGIRYRAHFVSSMKSYDYSETLIENSAEELSHAKLSKQNWDLVWQGMYLVGNKSYADFSSVPCEVAAKTGTTTVEKRINGHKVDTYNGLILSFAPYQNPEICCSVVIEGAGSGGSTAPVAAAVMKEYFAKSTVEDSSVVENKLLG